MSQGGHSEQLLFFALYYQSTPSCLKVRGGVGWVGCVAHVIFESAQGPNPFFSFYLTFIQLGSLLGPGFGPGLDNTQCIFMNFSIQFVWILIFCSISLVSVAFIITSRIYKKMYPEMKLNSNEVVLIPFRFVIYSPPTQNWSLMFYWLLLPLSQD